MNKKSAIVIGAGIAGLAIARTLAVKGYQVTVFERSDFASGASIRNFGMVWPIGQPGNLYHTAMRSREIWKGMGKEKAFWFRETGSLHLAYHEDEWKVLQELAGDFGKERNISLLNAQEVIERSPAVVRDGLLGGLFSSDEMIVDPREAIAKTAVYLKEKLNVKFRWNVCITGTDSHAIITSEGHRHEADLVILCSGPDLETLYPEEFRKIQLTKCKLQMMRFVSQEGWDIGPALCGGLSLIHYKSFAGASSLPLLKKRYEEELPDYINYGIHVMVSQNGKGELTVGDSHEYAVSHDPFDRKHINDMILKYLRTFARFRDNSILETWNGVYAKIINGSSHFFVSPKPGVYVFNGLGGNGMTLSFGLAEQVAEQF
jgi:FAD dependent oxidoreductase TIGR03364